ncbi:MAG: CdvA-like protein [Candidatus Bathyarchaeia archaeon]
MISWKYSLEKIIGELELAQKKKDALEKLLNEEKVSQPTYDSFTRQIDTGIAEIEERQTLLVQKMRNKIKEMEEQMRLLEVLLVNSEIRRVSGEIEEETYSRENTVLSLGLDTTKGELVKIKDAITSLGYSEPEASPPEVSEETHAVEPEVETNPEQRIEIIMDTGSDDDEATMPQQASEEKPEEHTEPFPPEEHSEQSDVEAASPEENMVEQTPTEETVTEESPVEEIFTPFQSEETSPSENTAEQDKVVEKPVEPLQDITEEETGF